ncbi:MAG TPA: efflux RND transporter periplasmic adaptor subunit [Burkholderiaceae bacterium]|nr:efflux RND transporter periplasmic adaptor subunit [Burkholderiaceae bacterium]
MTGRTRWWLAGVVVLAVGGIGLSVYQGIVRSNAKAAEKKKEAPPLEFAAHDIVQLASRVLTADLLLPGTVQAVSQATVRSKVSAEVRTVSVREGDRVRSGQVVVEFDTAQLRMQLAERQATLESARAQLAQTERTREVNAQLVKQNFISQNAFDTADAAYRAQRAAVAAAGAQLEQTKLTLADAVVHAPIGGLVSKRLVQPGEKVAFDTPLLSIVDLSQMEVQAQAAVSDITHVAIGARAEVEIEGLSDRTFAARVERINPSAEPGSRTINVYIGLPNENALLKAGMFARVRLRVQRDKEVSALPASAIQSDAGQSIVWVIDEGRLVKRLVTIGRRDDRAQLVEIVSGLGPGDLVVATKFDNLRDGLAARIMGGAAAPASVADRDAPRSHAN